MAGRPLCCRDWLVGGALWSCRCWPSDCLLKKAMEWGLVNRLYEDQDDLMAGALQIAQKLANGPRSLSLIAARLIGKPGRILLNSN